MGGFVGGMIAGAIVIVLLGAALSLTTPLTRKPTVAESAAVAEPAEPQVADEKPAESIADADILTVPNHVGDAPEKLGDSLAALSDLETDPDAEPQVNNQAAQVAAVAPVETSDVVVQAEAPIAPQSPSALPAAPQEGVGPDVNEQAPEAPAEIAEDTTEVEVVKDAPAPSIVVPETLPQAPEVVEQPQQPAALPEPEIAQDDEVDPFENSPIAVEGDEDTLPRELPRIASVPQIGGEQAETNARLIGKRIVPLTERDEAEPTKAIAGATTPSGKPIEAYAARFENPEAKPLMSIILIDDEGAYGAEALKDFPYPISFAVSPSDPDAAEKMARHRAAGFEVLALADLPKAASAQDAEVSLSVWLDTLPETVGILEGVETGIQGNRKLADQVAEIAAGTGRGLITQDNGLNTVQKLAARNGTPSGVIFRDIDGARQDPKIMRRFLDQAAFRAGQEGTVVMLGRLRPDTISALLLWGLEDRGNRVAMAPISAVMIKAVQ